MDEVVSDIGRKIGEKFKKIRKEHGYSKKSRVSAFFNWRKNSAICRQGEKETWNTGGFNYMKV